MSPSYFTFAAAALSIFGAANAAASTSCTFIPDSSRSSAVATSTTTRSSYSNLYGHNSTSFTAPSGTGSGGSPSHYGNSTLATSTTSTSYTTSTVYTTKVHTVTSCAASITNCHAGGVTTEIIPLYTTICPVTATQSPSVIPTTSIIYASTTRTLIFCTNGEASCNGAETTTVQTAKVSVGTSVGTVTVAPTPAASNGGGSIDISSTIGLIPSVPGVPEVPAASSTPTGVAPGSGGAAGGTGAAPAPSASGSAAVGANAAGRVRAGEAMVGLLVVAAGALLL